jgi:predicted dehydrogenase/threonine dehydrogenase-like Zn-dependent dehydrogenase
MNQLTQQLKSGLMEVIEVPFPALNKANILVQNHFSVISAGTEGKTVTDARKGYIAKAQSRQNELKQVIEMIKSNGFIPTYKFVMNKLEAPSALGYSCAGEVIAVGEGVTDFKVGDYVACGGNNASHSEIVSIPTNLAVSVPQHVNLKYAAFTTIGSIAIQGIRQADLRMGENCLIIGMGIIGQLTYKILEVSGINPIAVDVSEVQVNQSYDAGIKHVYLRNQAGIEEIIQNYSRGYGVDAIIITAGTSSYDPIEFAGAMARKKAKVVIVGSVPTGFSRANYYKKELDLRMSTSYGPGRSDIQYEEKGIDYPIAYVRWTENRNMQSFVDLLATERLDISPLISHIYELYDARKAYDMILARKESYSGILIQYDVSPKSSKKIEISRIKTSSSDVNVGLIGAGSFAQGSLLPNMIGLCNFVGVATGRGNTARHVGEKYSFNYLASTGEELIEDLNINTIFIATRHNLHAEYVIKSIRGNKHIFVEKPLAMSERELLDVKVAYQKMPGNHLMVGFNRRFSPAVKELKKIFVREQTKSIIIRVNSGNMPVDHWVNDTEIGGGRIIGEACHFIDLAMFLADSPIVSVSADSMDDPNKLNNTVVINLKMENGSVASINYLSNGSKDLPKEHIEVFCGGMVVQIDDFKSLKIFGKKSKVFKYKRQDKGHAAGVLSFLKSIKEGLECPIPFNESYLSMLATFKVNQSLMENRKIFIDY